MTMEPQPGTPRFRAMMIFGLVLAILLLLAGIGALLWGGGALLGWFMIAAGGIIAIVALLQLRRR